MTVAALIKHLQTLNPNALVAYQCYSEYRLLHADDITVEKLQKPRPDGWVARVWNSKPTDPTIPTVDYVAFPGN